MNAKYSGMSKEEVRANIASAIQISDPINKALEGHGGIQITDNNKFIAWVYYRAERQLEANDRVKDILATFGLILSKPINKSGVYKVVDTNTPKLLSLIV